MKLNPVYLTALLLCSISTSKAQDPATRTRPMVSVENHADNQSIKATIDFLENDQSDGSKSLCTPAYSTGCGEGDGFTSFAVEQIQNIGSGCANLNGTGWSQYLGLGPAILMPGNTYNFYMQTGYNDQYTTIWIDFNDDLVLTNDEKILTNFVMQQAGQLYSVPVTIPAGSLPGQHIMRARTRWAGPCDDPCNNYQYGEAEDYYIFIGIPLFGSLSGVVTKLADGSPVDNASIELLGTYSYNTLTGSDGSYTINNIMIGDYSVVCNKQGYNTQTIFAPIAEDSTTIVDFQLTQPQIYIAPLTVEKTLAPGSSGEKEIMIMNSGNGQLDWSASVQITGGSTKDFMDLQFQYPVGVGGGEAGIETDGNFIYTSKWNGSEFYKYSLDGIYLGSFTINGAAAVRDMCYDGNYFYGAAATPLVFEMDFNNQVLVSSFMAPTACRAIAYNTDQEIFYANNWSSPVVVFDKTGANLGSFNVGPSGGNYYGFAWDHATPGGPFLWGYAQTGASQNRIFQMQLPSGTETGFSLDLATKLSGSFYNGAGGLFTHPQLVFGKWTLGGLVQNQWIWGLELTDALTWISVSPSTGSLAGGGNQEVSVLLDATDLEAGIYHAIIYFTTYPDIGTPTVDATLNVFSGTPPAPDNFSTTTICETLTLCWNVAYADSFSIYNFGSWFANTSEFCFTFAGPDQYSITVTAWFGGLASAPSATIAFEILWPADAEPVGLVAEVLNDNIVWLTWSDPPGCAVPDGYNIYRNGLKMNDNIISELSYTDTDTLDVSEIYDYFTTSVYYFGESGPSNVVTVLVTDMEKIESGFLSIFPNPAEDIFYVTSNEVLLKLELFNQSGLYVVQGNYSGNRISVNVKAVPSGIYYLRITSVSKTFVRKIVVK